MGRPPLSGAPVFRFSSKEVQEMEKVLEDTKGAIPNRDMIRSLAEKFSASPERDGKILVQIKQVWTWFQNKRYSQKTKSTKVQGNAAPSPRDDSVAKRAVTSSAAVPSGRKAPDGAEMEFEAKSSRDGAWYDVASFVTHRMFESGDPEVRVRFAGFGAEEDEWVNVRKCVRQLSLPCESSECVAVLPGDLILCFQHFESFVREHFHQRGHYILGACNAYMMGAQVGCLSGEAMMGVHGRADTQSTSSIGFKIMLAKLIPKLVSAFKEVGADCEEFVNASEHFGHVEKATI